MEPQWRGAIEVGGDDVLVGSVVAKRYHVAGILGRGPTGTVFAVEHLHIGRRAAMKVLKPRYVEADAVHRVLHEDARAAWSVTHPCLCEVFDAGALPDGSFYVVTEYLEGETLAQRLARERMSLPSAIDVMVQLLSAIDAIHARGLLVRDLRPTNVFLAHRRGCRPVVKLLDFGLARLAPLDKLQEAWDGAAPSLTHFYYLSPERARSEHEIEPSSDLFVAGIVLYEMLTGRRPFTAASYHSLVLTIAHAAATPVSELRKDVPADLDAFVRRALSGNPRARQASATDMQDELRRIAAAMRSGAPAIPVIGGDDGLDSDETALDMPAVTVEPRAFSEPIQESDEPTQLRTNAFDPAALEQDDETATVQLTPELRARMEAMKRRVPSSSPPPATQRLDKPSR